MTCKYDLDIAGAWIREEETGSTHLRRTNLLKRVATAQVGEHA